MQPIGKAQNIKFAGNAQDVASYLHLPVAYENKSKSSWYGRLYNYITKNELDQDFFGLNNLRYDLTVMTGRLRNFGNSYFAASSSTGPSNLDKLLENLPQRITKAVESVVDPISKFFFSKTFEKGLLYNSLPAFGMGIVGSLWCLYNNSLGMIEAYLSRKENPNASLERAVDSTLNIGYYSGMILGYISGIGSSLRSLMLIGKHAIQWVPGLNIAMLVMCSSGIVKAGINTVQGIYKRHEFKKLISGTEVDENFQRVKDYIEHKLTPYQVGKYFGQDKDVILKVLRVIENLNVLKKDSLKHKQEAINLLSSRMLHINWINGVSASAGIVWFTASICAFTHAAVAVPAMLVVASIMGISVDIFSLYSRHSFNNGLDKLSQLPLPQRLPENLLNDIRTKNYTLKPVTFNGEPAVKTEKILVDLKSEPIDSPPLPPPPPPSPPQPQKKSPRIIRLMCKPYNAVRKIMQGQVNKCSTEQPFRNPVVS